MQNVLFQIYICISRKSSIRKSSPALAARARFHKVS